MKHNQHKVTQGHVEWHDVLLPPSLNNAISTEDESGQAKEDGAPAADIIPGPSSSSLSALCLVVFGKRSRHAQTASWNSVVPFLTYRPRAIVHDSSRDSQRHSVQHTCHRHLQGLHLYYHTNKSKAKCYQPGTGDTTYKLKQPRLAAGVGGPRQIAAPRMGSHLCGITHVTRTCDQRPTYTMQCRTPSQWTRLICTTRV